MYSRIRKWCLKALRKKKRERRKKIEGFTLLELIIVFAISTILSTVGIAAYLDYSHTQMVNKAASDVATYLIAYRSKAQAQVIKRSCSSGSSLTGFSVWIGYRDVATQDVTKYTSSYSCSGSANFIETKSLPQNISFTRSQSYTFPVIVGGATGFLGSCDTFNVTGFGKSRTITICATGSITSQ